MCKIQVDMFEVQLGAALLLQFRAKSGKAIRVLADAGVTAGGYPLNHVHKKLADAFSAFGRNRPRLDLIIGTHYDADHLEGLVPVIKDRNIGIGEAWMPPVANDTELHAEDDSIEDRNLLGRQFEREDCYHVLDSYLKSKAHVCQQLANLQSLASEIEGSNFKSRSDRDPFFETHMRDLDSAITYFADHITDSNGTLGASGVSHADEEAELPPPPESMIDWRNLLFHPGGLSLLPWQISDWGEHFRRTWSASPALAIPQVVSMAYIRRAAAKDAINATSLYKVVQALKNRGIPISYQMIEDGQPRRFVWKEKDARFMPGAQLVPDGPELKLLGPSEGLVKKHWNRLPIGNYLSVVAFKSIPVKSITPSNQLSYVTRFRANKQGVLICGDAGCVDFKPARGDYYQALLDSLKSLHIIQVAHHGGNNAHFYNVLLHAGYPKQTDPSLLLLSHAKQDRYRPSKEFALFIEKVRKEGDDVKLLFTSQPTSDKVREYRDIIHRVVGSPGRVGDIRIQYNGNKWNVLKHSVQIVP